MNAEELEPERRGVLKQLLAGAVVLASGGAASAAPQAQSVQRTLRPPGALPQGEFEARCIRCGQCGEACPNRCIQFFGLGSGPSVAYTPYIAPREQACILCMKCGDACPTGAIKPIAREAEAIIAEVNMGKAVVDTSICLSYQGKTCGVCYRACPLQDIAISVQLLEQPVVHDACVGCGLCERSCIQMPQAIRILPRASEAAV